MNGIHFYSVIWQSGSGAIDTTIEAATSRRWLVDHIRTGDVKHEDAPEAKPIKIQQIETPVIDFDWLVKTFETGCDKKARKEHAQEAAYVLHLVEKMAARVLYRDEVGEGEISERLVER